MIRTIVFAAAAALTLTTGAAMAQSVTQADVGGFVRDHNGAAIGSLQALNGSQARVLIGMFNTPGNHMVTVPVSELAAHDGQLVLNDVPGTTVAANR